MGMKRDIMQNFLQIIMMTGLLFLLATQGSIGAEEKSIKSISREKKPVLCTFLHSRVIKKLLIDN